jgi:glycine cleavage system transcriptional repressor
VKELVVLTAVGRDRVGIVERVSAEILKRGCNIEESRAAILGGEFALIVLVSGESDTIRALESMRSQLAETLDLEVMLRPTQVERTIDRGRPYRIESVSLDTPGIVYAVTTVLRERGINIDSLETDTTGAPFTGAPMFHASLSVIVPPETSIAELRRRFAEVADEYDLDISIRPIITTPDE